MHQLDDYDIYIFDCDGVILDSNQLKIDAMEIALTTELENNDKIYECINYFRNNFGQSRFHHVSHFLDNVTKVPEFNKKNLEQRILNNFSNQCSQLYLKANLTPGIKLFLESCKGKKYVASGSEQAELIKVFKQLGLDVYFNGIFGSPTKKTDIITSILEEEKNTNAVMIGDSESDMLSATKNNIDFIFYSPFSNVKEKMITQCKLYKHLIIDDFSLVRF